MRYFIILAVVSFFLITDLNKKKTLQTIKYEKALQIMIKKYDWKSDRLKTYVDLVYNTNNGAIYE